MDIEFNRKTEQDVDIIEKLSIIGIIISSIKLFDEMVVIARKF